MDRTWASAPPARALRAALFAGLCTTLSVASNVFLSGMPLPLPAVAAAAAAVFAVAYALAGRERRFRQIAALLVPLELAVDTVFTTGRDSCYGPAGGPVTGPWRSVSAAWLCDSGDVGASLAAVPGTVSPVAGASAAVGAGGHAAPWLLLAVHVAVGLAASAWLRHGEAALHRAVRSAVALARRSLFPLPARPVAVPDAVPQPWCGRAPEAGPRRLPLVHSVGRRGPPRDAVPAFA
ncbi:hypothetical protein GQS52_21035 [Streptomyces sp. SCUT-3]|uniref:hypothetical protein n=1 Tax=Streptomyces TaxID=1883 RepID=UPI0015F92F7D|nr:MULTISPECIES: hypothetical protein [unclassified Streptomyces]MCZ2526477.1 hypothetical protein [Streptomyces sp. HB2AG]QMV23846.1 hypothetical protein GQS52_21035 [Streptomyces sp. SCUT-3]